MSKPYVVQEKTFPLPSGARFGNSRAVRVAISFDDNQFEVLRDFAKAEGVSFSQAVRTFLNTAIRKRGEVSSAHKNSEAA